MIWTSIDTWIVIILIIVSSSAFIVGVPLVLRKESLLGDGISHAVLPGIAIGFMISGERLSIYMYIGAVIMGLITAVLSEYIATQRNIDSNAALGVVFSGLFAIGLILIQVFARQVDLDPSCVLFGSIELATLDTIALSDIFGGLIPSAFAFEVPRAVFSNGIVLLINMVVLIIIGRKLHISIFDPMFAKTIGIPIKLIRYFHVILVAITTVTAFESVGSILIVALLVLPQSIALLLSFRMKTIFIIGLVITILTSIVGHISAITIPPIFGYPDTNTVGSTVVVFGIILTLVLLFSPSRGVVIKNILLFNNKIKIAQEDILKALYNSRMKNFSVKNIRNLVQISIITGRVDIISVFLAKYILLFRRYILYKEGKYICTKSGNTIASHLLTHHRMWEDYFYSQVDMAAEQVHDFAEKFEHISSKHVVKALKQQASETSDIPGHIHTAIGPSTQKNTERQDDEAAADKQ